MFVCWYGMVMVIETTKTVMKSFALLLMIILGFLSVTAQSTDNILKVDTLNMKKKVVKNDEEWRKILSPVTYYVMREKGTERPFTGQYDDHYQPGTYYCAACGEKLFSSQTKFNAGCGWPSFYSPLFEDNIQIKIDRSHGMVRSEVLCSACGGHLGHVFNDGPPPSQLRYCINSVSLHFKADSTLSVSKE